MRGNKQMRLYKVTFSTPSGNNGFVYTTSKREADRRAKEYEHLMAPIGTAEVKTILVPLSREGVLRALNLHGGHPMK